MHQNKQILLSEKNISWSEVKLVVFDVDGTLYHQAPVRFKMLMHLVLHYALRPAKYKELLAMHFFRKEREKRAGYSSTNLEEEQYTWVAARSKTDVEKIRAVIERWMYRFPLPLLKRYQFPQATDLFRVLRQNRVKIAAYSDYPATEKLAVMGLVTDLTVAATDDDVNCLKPNPRALLQICRTFGLQKEQVLLIGDRDSRDGQCARNAGVPFIILPKNSRKKQKLFVNLTTLFSNQNQLQ